MKKYITTLVLISLSLCIGGCATVYIVRHATVQSIIDKREDADTKRYRIKKGWVATGFEIPTAIYDSQESAINQTQGKGVLLADGYFRDPFEPQLIIYKVDIEGTVHLMEDRGIGPDLEWPAALFNVSIHKSEPAGAGQPDNPPVKL